MRQKALAFSSRRTSYSKCFGREGCERLLDVGDEIVCRFQADAQSHEAMIVVGACGTGDGIRNGEARRARPAISDFKELQRIDEGKQSTCSRVGPALKTNEKRPDEPVKSRVQNSCPGHD